MGTCPALGSSKVLQPSENAKLKIRKAEVALEKDDTTTRVGGLWAQNASWQKCMKEHALTATLSILSFST